MFGLAAISSNKNQNLKQICLGTEKNKRHSRVKKKKKKDIEVEKNKFSSTSNKTKSNNRIDETNT